MTPVELERSITDIEEFLGKPFAYINRAVNAHEELVELVDHLTDYDCEQPDGVLCEKMGAIGGCDPCPPCRARQAIAKAEGQ